MKSYQVILLFLISLMTFSCIDDLTNYGVSIQPVSDQITLGTDTFHMLTENVYLESMLSQPDSFLLGSFYNQKFGSTQADILAQVNCPIDFKYPTGAVPDSARVVLYYKTWFGDPYAPMEVNIYEMNKSTFSYTGLYKTNVDPDVYTDKSILLGQCIFTAKDAMKQRKDTTSVTIKLSNNFLNKFSNDNYFKNDVNFTDYFKGMYITANYGAASILNLRKIDLEYYYHYTYINTETHKLDTVTNRLVFPANKEVRQVNRFLHADRLTVVKERDSVNYIASPANMQTRICLPLARIKDKMNAKIIGRKQILNKAILKVEATEMEDSTLSMPATQYLLLIKESYVDEFFKTKALPSDSAILGQLTASQIGSTSTYQYYYNYNIATLLANELKAATDNNTALANKLNLVLVPVSITTSTSTTSTSVTSVKQQYKMGAVTIRSGQNKKNPMKLNLIYSGF